MKKILLMAPCLILLVTGIYLCDGACKNSQRNQSKRPESGQSTDAPLAVAIGIDVSPLERLLKERWTGDLDGMGKRRVIRALVVYSKTHYFFDGMQPKGVTFDIMREFEDFVNRRLNTGDLRVHIAFVPVSRDQLIPALLDGRGDIAAANLTITPEREKQVEFSVPGLENVEELIITGPTAPKIAALDDLAGHEIFVRKSSSYYEHLVKLNDDFKKAGKKPIIIRLADENLEDEDMLEMVDVGLVGITVVDGHVARHWTNVFDNLTVHQDLSVHSGGKIAWAFRKGSPELREAINSFASTHKAGTPFGNAMLERYYGNQKRLKNATEDNEMKKFEALREIFKKYGDQYGLDWLLLAAQGYQESGLNQSARSKKGAVGIMQLLPSTAAGPPVNLPNIRTPDNNIHAGVKLLRAFIDSYFNEDRINNFNRGLLAVASYNAGPAAIHEMRKITANMGLDSNKWFNNVEVATSRHIGLETVQYVSNIFKYFVCYKMALEREREKEAAEAAAKAQK